MSAFHDRFYRPVQKSPSDDWRRSVAGERSWKWWCALALAYGISLIDVGSARGRASDEEGQGGAREQPNSALVATPEKPAKWSTKVDPATLAALKRGEKRLVVEVQAFKRNREGDGQLVVVLVSADPAKRQELRRIGIHPLMDFGPEDTPTKVQRFLMPVRDFSTFVDGEQLRLEIGFHSGIRAAQGGSAVIAVEVIEGKPIQK